MRGFCVDKSNPEVFDTTNVYGDIIDSDIHHMYYGMYSYGLQVSPVPVSGLNHPRASRESSRQNVWAQILAKLRSLG